MPKSPCASCCFVDCEQSVFSLKIRRVLIHGVFWHRERFKPKRHSGLRPRFSRLAVSPLARPTPATLKKNLKTSKSAVITYRALIWFWWFLKVLVFSLFLNFGIIDISSTPGQTDLLNSSEALCDRTSELALQQNFTPFVYREYVPLMKSHTECSGIIETVIIRKRI